MPQKKNIVIFRSHSPTRVKSPIYVQYGYIYVQYGYIFSTVVQQKEAVETFIKRNTIRSAIIES